MSQVEVSQVPEGELLPTLEQDSVLDYFDVSVSSLKLDYLSRTLRTIERSSVLPPAVTIRLVIVYC